jgi:hypothetical protein
MTLLLKTATAPKLRGSLSPARQYFVWAALLGLHLAWVGPCVADDAATIREFLLQGIAQRSESLKSATFTAHGRKTVPVSQPGEDVPAGEIIIRGAIDGARLRFDYGEPAFVAAPAKIADRIQENQRISREEAERLSKEAVDTFKEGDKKEITIARIETYYIRTPEKIAYWFNGHPTVFLVAPNSEVGPHIRRFDVNALGLYGWLEFQKGIGVSELLAGYRAIKKRRCARVESRGLAFVVCIRRHPHFQPLGDRRRLASGIYSRANEADRAEQKDKRVAGQTIFPNKLEERQRRLGAREIPNSERV